MTEPTAGMEGGSSKGGGGGREEGRNRGTGRGRRQLGHVEETEKDGWREGRGERQDQGKQDSENK